MTDRQEGALSRWARLKQESEAARKVEKNAEKTGVTNAALPAEAVTSGGVQRQDQEIGKQDKNNEGEEEEIRLEDLPDIETLTYESDFTAFLKKGVPAALQSKALAKLWRSHPIFAYQDGLTDYAQDFRTAEDIAQESKYFKLLQPESPAEMALEREQRLPKRGHEPLAGRKPVQQRRPRTSQGSGSGRATARESAQDAESPEAPEIKAEPGSDEA